MANDYFTGQGKPLDDKRLSLSGTTDAGDQQYRIWSDGQQILVPKGQSITKPLMPENVSANVRAFASIRRGYFRKPTVEFRNTVDFLLFDRYFLQTYRYDLPDDSIVDWHDHLGIEMLRLRYSIMFRNPDTGYTGRSNGVIETLYEGKGENGGSNWLTQNLTFDEYSNTHLKGLFSLVTNPTNEQNATGLKFSTGEFLQPVNLPIDVIIHNVVLVNGNSEMKLLTKNPLFTVELTDFTFEVLGGE